MREANESQASHSVEQADIFQYQSYSHSDDMFIIPFFFFFLVFLWLTCAISSEKSHYFISSEKSHYFLQFTIQPLPRIYFL
jgi:hypothetical protein